MRAFLLLPLGLVACFRPADNYPIHLFSEGMSLDEVLPDPEPMGGSVEYVRLRYWGTGLGDGLTGMYGDAPFSEGQGRTIGQAYFAYPKDPAFDRISTFLSPGPPITGEDACLSRTTITGYFSYSEFVDVGDHVAFTASDGTAIVLERDPATYYRPAGESWYTGYGAALQPILQGNDLLPDNWRGGETWDLSFPGTIMPPDATQGAVPYPQAGTPVVFPTDIDGVTLNGEEVRAPENGLDDVRYPGPWTEPLTVAWTPSANGEPVTVALRYLGRGEESGCSSDSDCERGFSCEQRYCRADEGSGLDVLGELVCTVVDDGEFVFEPEYLDNLDAFVDPRATRGAVLAVGRVSESSFDVADALTYNGKRVELSPIRTRILDLLYTRLSLPDQVQEVSP